MTLETDIALGMLQLVALSVPPIAVLIRMLRGADDLSWRLRKLSFGLAVTSVLSFIGAGAAVVAFLLSQAALPTTLVVGMTLAILGLVPFALFTGVLYVEHKRSYA
ncbi:hypothetical protein [Halomarina oriensis]|uniref:Uncharacterized protein n=1 Tax=Halomarina oriensis TaxID=671145 RepID=A0A6B0GER5_9EURY|nr:hypothetical protein [Halomarina oriensis]MWG33030.1 hypothetical protein [Halomarina oriensis]